MADAGPSSGRRPFMGPHCLHSASPIPALPFIGPHTTDFLSPIFASSASTQLGAIMDLTSANAAAPSLAYVRPAICITTTSYDI